jgi:hypothetical protein
MDKSSGVLKGGLFEFLFFILRVISSHRGRKTKVAVYRGKMSKEEILPPT